jgi:hypothetical protein
MSERLFNPGYVGFAVEATAGTAVVPTDFGQAYDFGITTNRNLEELPPAAGNVYGTQQVVAGLRDHTGDATLIFEPNTFEKLAAMMLAQSSRTGSGPYTSVYGISASNPPGKTYTIDVSDGIQAIRYYGCQVEKLATNVNNNEIQIKPTFSALGTFNGREVSSYTAGSPNVIVLKTDYDPSPTSGLVVGDTLQYVQANGTITNLVVSVITNGTTISTTPNSTTISGAAAGDWIRLKALTPTFTMLPPVLWSNTQLCFGATASAALSASQTRVEKGSMWELAFDFNDAKGEHRSGGQDPATLLRKPAKATLKIKKYFDTQADMLNYNSLVKTACVVRHYVYSGGTTYEVRITLNHLVTDNPIPKWKAGEINYEEFTYHCQYDTSDAQAFAVTVLNSNSSLT